MVRVVEGQASWRDAIDEEDLVCMEIDANYSYVPARKKRQPAQINFNRIEEWLNNKRVVIKNDDSVCFVCLRCAPTHRTNGVAAASQ